MTETLRCVIHHGELDTSTPADWLVCLRCSNRVLRHLRELEEYLPTLSLERSPSGGEPVSGPGFGSRSPANDSVLVHTDPRSDSSDREGHIDGQLGALGEASSYARMVGEETGTRTPNGYACLGYLRTHHVWIMRQPWVDEYAAAMRTVHADVRRLAGEPVQKPLGRCIASVGRRDCHGDVFELLPKPQAERTREEDHGGARCSSCRALYTGLGLVRLKAAQEA